MCWSLFSKKGLNPRPTGGEEKCLRCGRTEGESADIIRYLIGYVQLAHDSKKKYSSWDKSIESTVEGRAISVCGGVAVVEVVEDPAGGTSAGTVR